MHNKSPYVAGIIYWMLATTFVALLFFSSDKFGAIIGALGVLAFGMDVWKNGPPPLYG